MHRDSFPGRCIGRVVLFVNFHDKDAWKALGLFISSPWEGRQGLTWMDSIIFLEEAKGMHG